MRGATPAAILAVRFVAAIPACQVALASESFTLECAGTQTHSQRTNDKFAESSKAVTRLYTLTITKDRYGEESGDWYDWEVTNWFPIESISKNAYKLLDMRGGEIYLAINRNSGEWMELSKSGYGRGKDFEQYLTHGTCKKVALRMPAHL